MAAVGDAADYVLLRVMPQAGISVMENDGVRRQMVRVAEGTGAVMVYGYYAEQTENGLVKHPVIDCHEGSVRDDFDCGPLWMVKRAVLAEALAGMGDWHYGALYALRLYLMRNGKIVKFPGELCRIDRTDMRSSGEKQFDYVNPRNREVQVEMERIFTEHLHETGAYLTPRIRLIDPEEGPFEVEASVIIPVRNRERTVADAVKSALAQKAGFEFNVMLLTITALTLPEKLLNHWPRKTAGSCISCPKTRGMESGGAGISGYATQGVAAMPCSSTVMTYTKMKRFCRRLWINSGMSGAPW